MIFECHVCDGNFMTPLRTLDRRVLSESLAEVNGEIQRTHHIHVAEDIYQYDSKACRTAHEPIVIAQLKIKSPYPGSGTVVPCSRCGAPVDRTSPHVSYAWVTLEFRDDQDIIGHCTGDTELAVLCKQCEGPEPQVDVESRARLEHGISQTTV